ncbi:aminotransferase class V-fold PLP-dependent enzyme [Streptomyces sp. NPDC052042]|uniref:aminotransferase class V-fold PLP-dependent enzyme n=1 Tax=Streptomyces sp. NPDC052042 TaxID=3365683 RepID=UPI0037D11D07
MSGLHGPGERPRGGFSQLTSGLSLAEAASWWDLETTFHDTCSYGPPPRPAWEALQTSLDQWRHGLTPWQSWAESVQAARESFGLMVGISPERVATGAAVSQMLAPVAAAVPDGGTVLVPDIEFTSAVFPFAVHADRGVTVRTAPMASLVEAIDEQTSLVSFSAAQSATGEVADIVAITQRAREVGAVTVLDTTQAAGWLPVRATDVDFLTVAAYKWLCAPRGTAFLTAHADLAVRHPLFAARLKPLAAGWYAGQPGAHYGMPLRLAEDMRAFDISPAWHSWVGTAVALDVLNAVGVERIHQHNVALANSFRASLGLEASNSAIASVSVSEAAQRRMREAGIRFSVMDGRARFSFHLYNTQDDVERVLARIRG